MVKKRTILGTLFDGFNYLVLIVLSIVTLYPFLYVVFASFSDSNMLMGFTGLLYKPLGFSVAAYKAVLANSDVWIGYRNTIFYVVAGTCVNLIMTTLGAYILSRKEFYWNRVLMPMVLITMFFNGGLIPNFLLIDALGMYNTVWAIILPGAISAWNLMIMRTNFSTLPASLMESAKIDGASEIRILWSIVLPLSKAIIAVMILYYGVAHWNSWFNALIYLRKRELFPLQLFLREILIANETSDMMTQFSVDTDQQSIAESIQYATIMVATIPVICVYPFLQKYFVKGVMIGAIKG